MLLLLLLPLPPNPPSPPLSLTSSPTSSPLVTPSPVASPDLSLCFRPLCVLCPCGWLSSEAEDCFCDCDWLCSEGAGSGSELGPPAIVLLSSSAAVDFPVSVVVAIGVCTLSLSSTVSLVLRFLIGRAVSWTTGLVEDSLAALRLASAAKMAAAA